MAQLVLLVVAAVWAAVLIPPLLRSRLENRPNSSVVDFRRQLSKLQGTAAPSRGAMRSMGRPLTAAPRQHIQGGAISSRNVSRGTDVMLRRNPNEATRPAHRGAPAGRMHRSHEATVREHAAPTYTDDRVHAAPSQGRARQHGPSERNEQRNVRSQRSHGRQIEDRTHDMRTATVGSDVQRRRNNVTALLFVITGATLFLYATTKSDVLMYSFALSFLAFCGYVYLLTQLRQRELPPLSNDRWPGR